MILTMDWSISILNAALEDIVWSRAERLRELLYIYVEIFCS